VLDTLSRAVDSLRDRLQIAEHRADEAHARADRAEQRAVDERAAADRARDRAESAERRVSAQATIITGMEGEQEELQRHLNAAISAERTARDEATGFKAELEARRQWGLGRRIAWALSRKG
jgi:hypothetical protein